MLLRAVSPLACVRSTHREVAPNGPATDRRNPERAVTCELPARYTGVECSKGCTVAAVQRIPYSGTGSRYESSLGRRKLASLLRYRYGKEGGKCCVVSSVQFT